MFSHRIDMTGKKFFRWTVVEFAGFQGRLTLWKCRCDCGTEAAVLGGNLRRGGSRSCRACVPKAVKHGALRKNAEWPEYWAWAAMINRCYSANATRYPDYGGRGIAVCDRWRFGENGVTAFACYIADVGRRPSPGLSIDRIDNDGNYEPSNVRYATAKQQRRNRRPSKTRIAA